MPRPRARPSRPRCAETRRTEGLLAFRLVRIVEREAELVELRLIELEHLLHGFLAVVLLGGVRTDELGYFLAGVPLLPRRALTSVSSRS
jgi:hypothetical protein